MGPELMNISMTIMLDNITNKILSNMEKGITTWLYIDEFHIFLENPFTRDFFLTLWMKIRKVGGIPTALTQNISVILADSKMATLVSNSEYCMFLKQAVPDAQSIVKNSECISQAMTKYLINAQKGCGLIKFGNVVIPFDNHIDKKSPIYDIYNTNFHEKVAMQKSMEKAREVDE